MLYSEDDVHLLDWEQSCWDKEAIISSERVLDHILDMGIRSTWTGCSLNQTPPNHSEAEAASNSLSVSDDLTAQLTSSVDNGVNLTCRGERRYDAPKKVSVQLISSKCMPVYHLEACPFNKTAVNSVDFAIN